MTEYDYSPEAYERHLATQHRIARWVDTTNRHEPLNPFFPTPQPAQRALPPQRDERVYYSARVYPPREHYRPHQPVDAERERERARSAPTWHASTSQSQPQSHHHHRHHPQRSQSQPHPHSHTYNLATTTSAAPQPHRPRRAYTAPTPSSSPPPPSPPHARRTHTAPERPHEPRGTSYVLVNAPPPEATPNPFTGARPPPKPLLRRLLTWSGRVARRGGRTST
ncbi:hypothetical protein BD779DRAFT_1566992 [Infundibulicybe gibba]|nr:hypothetical protein BD779DRAFT_1566992 [Infundibulicybe gibba]